MNVMKYYVLEKEQSEDKGQTVPTLGVLSTTAVGRNTHELIVW